MKGINYSLTIAVIGLLALFALAQTKKPCGRYATEDKTSLADEIEEAAKDVKDNVLQKRVEEMPFKLFPLGPK